MATVFVTGGSGFVGGRLIARLVRDGHDVRALARGDAAAGKVEAVGAVAARGDLGDVAGLRDVMAGSELVFHAAARTSGGGDRARFWADNVVGTANVVRAAREAGVRRLVHVGTEAALMDGQPLVGVDETAPLRPDSRAHYAASKAAAEQLVLDANGGPGSAGGANGEPGSGGGAEGPGSAGGAKGEPGSAGGAGGFGSVGGVLETVVVRPRFVWGAGDTTVLPELVSMVNRGRFAWIGGGRHLTDTTHVDNAVEGLVLAAERGRPGQAYFVTDGHHVVFRDFVTELLATRGMTPPDRSLPLGLALTAASAAGTVWRVLRLPGGPPLDHLAVWLAGQECTIDIGKAVRELGYQPVRTRKEGMAEMRASK